jgi:hypothetical protein
MRRYDGKMGAVVGLAAMLLQSGCNVDLLFRGSAGDAVPTTRILPAGDSTRDPARPGDSRPGPGVADRTIRPFPIDGNFVPSGWMGDAEDPDGPLSYRVSREDPASEPTCEEWSYDPAKDGAQGWVAVAYQFPDKNWGDQRGKDLSNKGYTRIGFRARAVSGHPILVVRAGGHTRPGAPHPASFETDAEVIALRPEWTFHELPVGDLSNIVTALAFSLRRADCDGKVVICLDDIAFLGPDD